MSTHSLDAFWMPFTANKDFKKRPRMLVSAQGMHYQSEDGRNILDGTAGLWCCNAGHGRPEITEAVSKQLHQLDFAPSFQLGHPKAFELANRLAELSPSPLKHIFFTNSGSESVETALKVALAYHRARGKSSKTLLIGREKGYHGTNFGGISVGGLANNRRAFGNQLADIDHLAHPSPECHRFTKGLPECWEDHASELTAKVKLHGAENIAAVIVEPVVGAAGVYPPPKNYLQRLRAITAEHDILLIFDEVITGFGRLGDAFAAQRFNITPDIITTAKGLTNGTLPMGAVFIHADIHDAISSSTENAIELFHGYTYSGHPVACAAALATLDIYREESLFDRVNSLESYWQDTLHQLRSLPQVKDIRSFGLLAGIELHQNQEVGSQGKKVFDHCFWKENILVRAIGDTLALSPPLIIDKSQVEQLVESLSHAINHG